MEWTANRLIPTILGGGVAIGLLASTAITTQPKASPEPEWRLAARQAAFQSSNLAYVDHGPIDLSPNLPWIGTGPDGSVSPMPEDFYRGRIIPIRAGDHAVLQEPALGQVDAANFPMDERSAEIRRETEEPKLHGAVLETAQEPRFRTEAPRMWDQDYEDEAAADQSDEDADYGG